MFARQLKVEVLLDGQRRPCPLEWLDSFCMRRFTGEAAFDDTLPRADGLLEAGFRVDAARLAVEMSDWLTKKKGGGRRVEVEIRETESAAR
ncbi:MAG TPA: hypothetical protein VNN18_13355 [Candidatus Xenobia bacterium]|nr:hypothetical protein [Candidatus Xenobia bacterium]